MSILLDEMAARIYNNNIRTYFSEVLNSFYNENYRSAIVMLYSVVVCDLVLKLDELKKVYNDSTATSILSTIEIKQKQSPKSGEWEITLIDEIKSKDVLFEPDVFVNLEYMRTLRHLCAHPALDTSYELYMPNRETTSGCIMNMLCGVLTQPPILAKKVTSRLVSELSKLKDQFISDSDNFKKYLISVYFKKMNINMYLKVFKDMWKFAFVLNNSDADENRSINCRCLIEMQKYKMHEIWTEIKNNVGEYSNINSKTNIVKQFIYYLTKFPEIYEITSEGIRAIVSENINSNQKLKVISYFASPSIDEHIKSLCIDEDYTSENKYLYTAIKEAGHSLCEVHSYYIRLFSSSKSFDEANLKFDNYIFPYLSEFDQAHFEMIIDAINKNNQIYRRGRNASDNKKIQNYAKNKLPDDFDYSEYPEYKFEG